MKWLEKNGKYPVTVLLAVMLGVYLFAMVTINLADYPGFYITDMYTDMNYAQKAWEHKSVFPEGWIFGNQIYVAATPVLAALFYGITADHSLAMGLASTVMAVLVLYSFFWMLKPVFPGVNERLVGAVLFVSVVLWYGDAVYLSRGWQLLFTMCSYYACYAITAFLAFGCYLRKGKSVPALAAAVLLAFCMGMQSLRQTAVMTAPLLAVEGVRLVLRACKKEKLLGGGCVTALLIAAANLAGLVFVRLLDIPQVEIFGKLRFVPVAEGLQGISQSIENAFSLFYAQEDAKQKLLLASLLLVGVGVLCLLCKDKKGLTVLGLLTLSVGAVLGVDVFTTLYVRNIYYFMLYPLAGVLVVCVYAHGGKAVRSAVLVGLVLFFGNCCKDKLSHVWETARAGDDGRYGEVIELLQENGYTTIYSGWNRGEKIAVASDWEIEIGFWDAPSKPFDSVEYLCDPAVFDADSGRCAYVFFGEKEAQTGITAAQARNIELELLAYFHRSNVYIYTAEVNLME